MDLTSQSAGNSRTPPNLTKRRRIENSTHTPQPLHPQELYQVGRLHRAYRWKLAMMSSYHEGSGGSQATESQSLTGKSNKQDSTQTEKDKKHLDLEKQEGLKKKARRSSVDSPTLRSEHELVGDEKSLISSELPNPEAVSEDPDSFLIRLVQAQSGATLKVKAALDLHDFFPEITDAQVAAYDTQTVTACRNNEVEALKSLWKGGHSLECCNRFGESLLHMACRRGFLEVVQFLLEEVGLAVRIRDDCGRTPLHDAFWNAQPQLRICEMLIERDPGLLLIADKRGHTPFKYARETHWPLWRKMLFDHSEQLHCLASQETMKYFS